MPLAVLDPEPEPNIESEPLALVEPLALLAYQRHTAGCLDCDPGRGLLCHTGHVLHNRWAEAAQRESNE